MKSKGKQIALNMVSQIIAFALSLAINFFLIPVIIEKIGKEIYGFYSLADNFLEYATVITAVINGMANRYITVAYSKGETENANRYFTSVTLMNVFLTVILAIPALFLVLFLEKLINVPARHVLDIKCLWAFTFLMFFVNLIFSRYEVAAFVKNRLEITAFINMTSMLAKAILLILVYSFLYPYIGYIGVIVFFCAVYAAFVKVHFKKKLTPDLQFKRELFDFATVKELAKVGVWNSVSQLSQLLFTGLDLLIANLFIGAEEMSILSIAKTLPVMIIGFIGVIAGAFYPAMTISYSTQSTEDFLGETKFASKMCGFICSVPVMGIVVFGKEFFGLWLPTLSAAEINQIQLLSILTLIPQMLSIYVFPLYMNRHGLIDDIPIVMISGADSDSYIRQAYSLGASDYISRPFDSKVVYRRVFNIIKLYSKQRRLISIVSEQAREKEKNNRMMIDIFSQIVEFRNGESGMHVLRVNTLTAMILESLLKKTDRYNLSWADCSFIATASALHDIGKMRIDPAILNKKGKLTDEEFEIMKTHTILGAEMLEELDMYKNEKLVKTAIEICRWHHERYDGKGYPDGLKGDEIPISAQVVALADVYDALVSKRVYKEVYAHDKAVQMIFDGECGSFNPILLECLEELSDRIQHEISEQKVWR